MVRKGSTITSQERAKAPAEREASRGRGNPQEEQLTDKSKLIVIHSKLGQR